MLYFEQMERLDDLQYNGLMLYQDTNYACFGADALQLCSFLRLTPKDSAVELGSGSGVVCILGAAKTGARFTGVGRQARLVELAQKSAARNGQEIRFLVADVADAANLLGRGVFSAAVMNPPYFSSGEQSPNPSRAAARHDAAQALNVFLSAAFALLNNGGKLFVIYPASGLSALFAALREHRLEPKRMRLLYAKSGESALRVLIEAKKLGNPGLVIEPPDWMQQA